MLFFFHQDNFLGSGKNQVRIAYVINCDDLKRCCDLIKNGLIKYKELGNK